MHQTGDQPDLPCAITRDPGAIYRPISLSFLLVRFDQKRIHSVAIFLAALACSMLLLAVIGISDGGDSGRYYDSASALLNGELPRGKARSYLGYSIFVTPFVALGLGKVAIAMAQIALSAIAAVCLYLIGERFFGARIGLTAALLYALYPDIQYWNLIIYAESVFASMLVISMWLVLRTHDGPSLALALCVVAFTCTVRPHGVGFALAAGVYGLYLLWLQKKHKTMVIVAVGAVICAPVCWKLLGVMVGHERVLDIYLSGEVIWGYAGNALEPAADIRESRAQFDHPVSAVLGFVAEQPGYFLSLMSRKLFYLYAHVRPYFSDLHNLLSIVYLVPAYIFAVVGLPVSDDGQRPARVLLVSTFLFLSGISALTFVDWDGRFLIPLLSVVFLYAAIGLWRTWRWLGWGGN